MTGAFFVWLGYAFKTTKLLEKEIPTPILLFLLALASYISINTPVLHIVGNRFYGGWMNVFCAISMSFLLLKLCQKLERYDKIMKPLLFIGKDTLVLLAIHTCESIVIKYNDLASQLTAFGIRPSYWLILGIRLLIIFFIYGLYVLLRYGLRLAKKNGLSRAKLFSKLGTGIRLTIAFVIVLGLGFSGGSMADTLGHAKIVYDVSVRDEVMIAGDIQQFTVCTSRDVSELSVYTDNMKLYKSWSAEENSALEQGRRIWTLETKITGKGARNLTFAPGTNDWIPFGAKTVSFDVFDRGVTRAQCVRREIVSGEEMEFEVITTPDCDYLTLIVENGKTHKIWDAQSYSEADENQKVWHVSLPVKDTGIRKFKFAAYIGDQQAAQTQRVWFVVRKG